MNWNQRETNYQHAYKYKQNTKMYLQNKRFKSYSPGTKEQVEYDDNIHKTIHQKTNRQSEIISSQKLKSERKNVFLIQIKIVRGKSGLNELHHCC